MECQLRLSSHAYEHGLFCVLDLDPLPETFEYINHGTSIPNYNVGSNISLKGGRRRTVTREACLVLHILALPMKNLLVSLFLLSNIVFADCNAMKVWVQKMAQDSQVVEITHWDGLVIDLRYAQEQNLVHRDLYCKETRAFLQRVAALKLQVALDILRKEHPGYKLLIWDAARPLFAQQALRDLVRGTPMTSYVTSASTGSLHNYGMALDLSVQKPDGSKMDMGTDFDDLSPKAGATAKVEDSLVQSGALDARQISDRRGLRSVMRRAGWIQLPSEWWHFNAAFAADVRANMKILGK
jgi:zinc D-Ala-D-Ala dipeptidase